MKTRKQTIAGERQRVDDRFSSQSITARGSSASVDPRSAFVAEVCGRPWSSALLVLYALLRPCLHALRTWMDSWAGIGRVAVGMHRQGYDLQLTQHNERGWRATFYTTGMEHSPTSATGTGWEYTPWHAVQSAAWEALWKAGR